MVDSNSVAELSSTSSGEVRPQSRSVRGRLRAFAYILALAVVAVGWAIVAPAVGMGTVGILVLYFVFAIGFMAIVAALAAGGGWIRRGGAAVLQIVAVPALLYAETDAIRAYLHAYPPPRPMFHNHFMDHEGTLLPFWHRPLPATDRFGQLAWSDYADNILVIVCPGERIPGRVDACIFASMNSTEFKVGDVTSDKSLIVPRVPDRVYVMLPNGAALSASCSSGSARGFSDSARTNYNTINLARDVVRLLDATDRDRFGQFIADYREPPPREP